MTITSIEVRAAPLAAIPAGEGRTFDLGGERIAIFHSRNGNVFATQASCPHKGGPLADGLMGGDTLICPLQTWRWDLKTGSALMGSCGLKTYPARLDSENRIVVTLSPDAPNESQQ